MKTISKNQNVENHPEFEPIPWIDTDMKGHDIEAIQYGGCASGAYMPAVTYYKAAKIMAKHGNDVLEYIEDCCGELPQVTRCESWDDITVFFLSYAVDLWADTWEVVESIEDAMPDEFKTFHDAYVVALLCSSNTTDEQGNMVEGLEHETTSLEFDERAVADCKNFFEYNYHLMNENWTQAGHDFALTRNGHGTGFWDRGDDVYSKAQRDKLTEASEAAGSVDLYLHDGEVCIA